MSSGKSSTQPGPSGQQMHQLRAEQGGAGTAADRSRMTHSGLKAKRRAGQGDGDKEARSPRSDRRQRGRQQGKAHEHKAAELGVQRHDRKSV